MKAGHLTTNGRTPVRPARRRRALDVDGVLNPVPLGPGFAAHDLMDRTVPLSADHAARLRELSARYELVRATTWEHGANSRIAPLRDLPALPVVEFSRHRSRPDDPRFEGPQCLLARKWAPLLRHAGRRPFAWGDDVMPDGLARCGRRRPGRLLLPVDPARGCAGTTWTDCWPARRGRPPLEADDPSAKSGRRS
ncbi:HAD domain-containing protein [Streptomyces noursei]|uniref:HAD domain-containing protein n=1 Tax=Streptomyces noursei TaxID=1971 RepID=UPI0033184314